MQSKPGSFSQRVVLAGLIAGGGILAASAYAVSTDRADTKPRCEARAHQQGEGGGQARRDARLAELKEKLKLGEGQQAAWNAFAAAAQPGSRHAGRDHRAMREQFAQLSTPERLDRMQEMAEKRHARMAQRAEAIKAFYAQLTPEQQRIFDAEAMLRLQRGHHAPHRMS